MGAKGGGGKEGGRGGGRGERKGGRESQVPKYMYMCGIKHCPDLYLIVDPTRKELLICVVECHSCDLIRVVQSLNSILLSDIPHLQGAREGRGLISGGRS